MAVELTSSFTEVVIAGWKERLVYPAALSLGMLPGCSDLPNPSNLPVKTAPVSPHESVRPYYAKVQRLIQDLDGLINHRGDVREIAPRLSKFVGRRYTPEQLATMETADFKALKAVVTKKGELPSWEIPNTELK